MVIEKIYFDMDGVLADFDRGIIELCHMEPRDQDDWVPGADLPMWDKIREVGHFYDKLHLLPGAKELFDTLYAKYGDKCEILSGVPKPDKRIDDAREDKIRWAHRELAPDLKLNLVYRAEKQDYAKGKGYILIDDLKINIKEWNDSGGTGVYFKSKDEALELIRKIEEE